MILQWLTQKYILINENLILLLMLFIFQRPSAASPKTQSLASDLIIIPYQTAFVNTFLKKSLNFFKNYFLP